MYISPRHGYMQGKRRILQSYLIVLIYLVSNVFRCLVTVSLHLLSFWHCLASRNWMTAFVCAGRTLFYAKAFVVSSSFISMPKGFLSARSLSRAIFPSCLLVEVNLLSTGLCTSFRKRPPIPIFSHFFVIAGRRNKSSLKNHWVAGNAFWHCRGVSYFARQVHAVHCLAFWQHVYFFRHLTAQLHWAERFSFCVSVSFLNPTLSHLKSACEPSLSKHM